MKWFADANMFYFDAQSKLDPDCDGDSDSDGDRVKTCNGFMNYGLELGSFTRSHGAKGRLEHQVKCHD
jgi:hypothetical protein